VGLNPSLLSEHVKLVTFVDAVTHRAVSSTNGAETKSMLLAIICNVESEFEQASSVSLNLSTILSLVSNSSHLWLFRLLLVSCAGQPTAILAVLPIVSAMDISISEVNTPNKEPDHLARLGNDTTQDPAPKGIHSTFLLNIPPGDSEHT
jgi:hypothetical protein